MNFADITDIAIPAGDVIKIQAQDGTVLWEKSANGKMPLNAGYVAVAYSNELRLFCAICGVKVGYTAAHLLTSQDGVNWTRKNDVGYIGTQMLYIANLGGFVFPHTVPSGTGGLLTASAFSVSSNGTQINSTTGFSDAAAPFTAWGECYDSNNGVLYIISGNGITWGDVRHFGVSLSDRASGCISYSPELKTVTSLVSNTAGVSKCSVAANLNKYAVTSDWQSLSGPTGLWRSMCWSSKLRKFCAVGDGTNHVALSSDGKTWNAYTAPYENLTSVCWGEEAGLFCAVSRTNNVAFTSKDGINWTEHNTPAGAWNSVCWSSRLKMFCAVGNTDNVFNLKV